MNMPATAAENRELVKSLRSRTGSASRRWRPANRTPKPMPAAIDQVDPGCGRGLVLGQQERRGNEQQQHHRHAEQEHGAPPEVLEHQSADQRSDGHATHEAREPDRDGEAPLGVVAEHVGDERHDGRRQRRPGDA
jgi:hypothetical protein